MDVLFLGSGAFGVPTLAELARAGGPHRVVGVVTQPDRPAGRGMGATPTPVAQWVAANRPDLPVLKPENVNEPGVLAEIRSRFGPYAGSGSTGAGERVGAWVVIAFGQKLCPPLLAGVAAMNLHASLLPRWRGAAPIHAAILAGDQVTGNSVITLADKMDAGLVLGTSRREIVPRHTTGELHDLLAADGPALVLEVLSRYAAAGAGAAGPGGEADAAAVLAGLGQPQDHAAVTLARKLSKADGWVDFSRPAAEAVRRVHALNPWPGVTLSIGGKTVKVHRAEAGGGGAGGDAAAGGGGGGGGVAGELAAGAIGMLVDPATGAVRCGGLVESSRGIAGVGAAMAGGVGEGGGGDSGATVFRMLEVQAPGGRVTAWADFARGQRPALAVGTPVANTVPVGGGNAGKIGGSERR